MGGFFPRQGAWSVVSTAADGYCWICGRLLLRLMNAAYKHRLHPSFFPGRWYPMIHCSVSKGNKKQRLSFFRYFLLHSIKIHHGLKSLFLDVYQRSWRKLCCSEMINEMQLQVRILELNPNCFFLIYLCVTFSVSYSSIGKMCEYVPTHLKFEGMSYKMYLYGNSSVWSCKHTSIQRLNVSFHSSFCSVPGLWGAWPTWAAHTH